MVTPVTTDRDEFIAERNSAFTIGVLHFFVVFAAAALMWDSPVLEQQNLLIWLIGEATLGLISFAAFLCVRRGRMDKFLLVSRVESVGTAFSFSALAWLGPNIASGTPSKHVLMLALVAVTSIAAANSSHITVRRPFFDRLVIIVAISYSLAFAVHSEWVFAVLAVLWCASITTLTRVGYQGMRELLALREASEQTARHDDLTGLLSRAAFFEMLTEQHPDASRADPTEPFVGLVLFDLDGFKAINDAFGHVAGDAVLRSVANRLTLFLPENAIIGRLGGDEFAAIVPQPEAMLKPTVESALAAVADPIKFDERELYVAASAGWTEVPTGKIVPAELMAQADAAMYQSKNSQTAVSTGFDVGLRDELDRSLELRQRFRSALKRGEIEFWAQPLVRTADSAPIAIELLARWPQDDSTVIGPLEFTRVADETGLAVELDRLALSAARDLLVDWQTDPLLSTMTVKANISPVHLHNNGLIQSVQELMPSLLRERLGLEFVESRLIPAAERNHAQMRRMLDMGIALSIDDFGVGYSSLTYLRSLPVSEIKIDRSFVTDVDTDRINQGLIRAIVDIASTLGLPTVAEGIETEAEFKAVARLGVSIGQGYLLGRPVPLAEATNVMRDLQESAASLQP